MATEAQINANRANAKKSTGPVTPAGKAASSMNALKHGLTAKALVIPGETAEDFTAFHSSVVDDLAPSGALQEELASRIALLLWRLRRAAKAETLLMHCNTELEHTLLNNPLYKSTAESWDKLRLSGSWLSHAKTYENIARYETSLERQLRFTLKQYRDEQKRRGVDCAGTRTSPEPAAADASEAAKHSEVELAAPSSLSACGHAQAEPDETAEASPLPLPEAPPEERSADEPAASPPKRIDAGLNAGGMDERAVRMYPDGRERSAGGASEPAGGRAVGLDVPEDELLKELELSGKGLL